jgi:Tol biopolymer transport system component
VTATQAAKPTGTPQPAGAGGAPSGSIIFDTFDKGQYLINQVRADGTGLKVLFADASEPALSPNGTILAYHKRKGAGPQGLWTASLNGTNPSQIVNASNAGYPTWSPDGNNIAYNLFPNGPVPNQIFWATRDGSSSQVIGFGVRPAWQPGGSNTLIFDGCDGNGANCYSLYTENAYTPDVKNPKFIAAGTNAAWSPNGSEIVFQANDASGINIYVVNHDGSNKRAVTKDSGHSGDPIWSSDGQWIFYRSDKSGVWALYAVRADGTEARKIVDAPVNADNWDFEKLAIAP